MLDAMGRGQRPNLERSAIPATVGELPFGRCRPPLGGEVEGRVDLGLPRRARVERRWADAPFAAAPANRTSQKNCARKSIPRTDRPIIGLPGMSPNRREVTSLTLKRRPAPAHFGAMIEIRKFDSLGHADHGWLNARHHFTFANYHDPAAHELGRDPRMERRPDRGQERLSAAPAPRHGDRHLCPHGRDHPPGLLGNKGRTGAGDVQVMSAGSGVVHAEYNLEDEQTTLFQIWIETDRPRRPAVLGRDAVPQGIARRALSAARQRRRA